MKQRGPLASMARQGIGTDTMVGHLTPGEVVIPRKLTAEQSVMQKLKKAFEENGLNFQQYVVGAEANRPNPHTGAPMFEGGGDPGEGAASEGGNTGGGGGGMGAEGGTGRGDGGTGEGQTGDGGGQMGAEGGTGYGDGGQIGEGATPGSSGEGATPGTSGEGATPGATGEGATPGAVGEGATPGTGPGAAPGTSDSTSDTDSDPTGSTPGSVMGGGTSLGAVAGTAGPTSTSTADEADNPADQPSQNATPTAGVVGPSAQQIGGFSIPGTTATTNPVTGAPQIDGVNQATVSVDLGNQQTSVGTIGNTIGGGQFGTTGPVGTGPGTIGGSVPGGPNANFGDSGVTGYGGATSAAAQAAADAAAAAAQATGAAAPGVAGPDSYGGFSTTGVTSNDIDATTPFGGQSTGVLSGTVSPTATMGFGVDKAGISIGAPYTGADIDTGLLGAGGVPGSRGNALADQAAQMAAQAANTITGRGTTVAEAMADMAAQKAAAQQAQQTGPTTAAPSVSTAQPTQAPAPAPTATTPSFNVADIAAAIASMGSRPGVATADDQSTTGPSQSKGQTASPTAQAAQAARSASSIAAPEQSPSTFSNIASGILGALSNTFSPTNIGTVAINAGLGLTNPALSLGLQAGSYLGTGQSFGANMMGALTGQGIPLGGLAGAIANGGPTAGYNTGPSNPNLGQSDGGGGGYYIPTGNAGPVGAGSGGAYGGGYGVATGYGSGQQQSPTYQRATPYTPRQYVGAPLNAASYGYGPQYTYYAAEGGHVKGPLSMMRQG